MLFPWPRLLCTVYTRCSPLLSFSTWQMQRVASTEGLTLTLYTAGLRKHRFTQDPSRSCAHAEACWANLWALLMLLLKIFIYLLLNIYALNDMWWDTLNLLVSQGQKRMSSSPWPPLGAMHDFLLCAPTWVTPPPPPSVVTSLLLHILASIHTRCLHCVTGYSRRSMVLCSVLTSAATYEPGPF